jgi:hypothetical protein
VKIAETALAIAVTCFLFHGHCQGQEPAASGPAPSSQANSVLFDMQQKLNDMRDQLAAQKASSPHFIWSLYDMRQKLDDMHDQIAAMRDRVQGMGDRIQDTRDRVQDIRDQMQDLRGQIQFRTEQMQRNVAIGMEMQTLEPGFHTYEALATHSYAEGEAAALLLDAFHLGEVYAVSKGYLPLTEAPFVGLGYQFFIAVPDPFNPSRCSGGGSCRILESSRTVQTSQGSRYSYYAIEMPLQSSYSNAPSETKRASIPAPPIKPPSDTRQYSPKGPMITINGCRATNDIPCSPPSIHPNAFGPGRPPPNPNHSGDDNGGNGGRGTRIADPAGVDIDIRPVRAGEAPAGLAQSIIDSRKRCTTAVCPVQ